MIVTVKDGVLTYDSEVSGEIETGQITAVEFIDDNFIHVTYGEGTIAGCIVSELSVNGETFPNAQAVINKFYNR
jgi:hypothetical protein